MSRSRRTSSVAWWLPAVVAAAVVPGLFVLGMRSDPPEVRAGAEPVVSGILFSAPFVVLLLFDLVGGLWASLGGSRRERRDALTMMTVAAALVAGMLVWVLGGATAGEGRVEQVGFAVLLALAVLVPVVPAWVEQRRTAVPDRGSGRRGDAPH